MYSDNSCTSTSSIKIEGGSFTTITSVNDGGGFYLSCADSSLQIYKDSASVATTFTSVTSTKGQGGVIYAAIKSINV